MVDRVKPLKIESTVYGSQDDFGYPTEMNPTEDYAAVKGLAFENSNDFRIEKLGRDVTALVPDRTNKVVYLGNGEVDYIEIFQGATQTEANRILKIQMAYDGNSDPSTETWSYYDTDGTTVLRTVIYTHTFTGGEYSKTVSETT